MDYKVQFDWRTLNRDDPHPAARVLGGQNGACMGVTLVVSEHYAAEAAHEDQEGFFVADGHGFALIDGREIAIDENSYLLLPSGTRHCFRKALGGPDMRLLWFHASD